MTIHQSSGQPDGLVPTDADLNLTDQQIARVSDLGWYHAYDFGSHQTPGRFEPDQPANMTLFGVMDLLAGVEIAGRIALMSVQRTASSP